MKKLKLMRDGCVLDVLNKLRRPRPPIHPPIPPRSSQHFVKRSRRKKSETLFCAMQLKPGFHCGVLWRFQWRGGMHLTPFERFTIAAVAAEYWLREAERVNTDQGYREAYDYAQAWRMWGKR